MFGYPLMGAISLAFQKNKVELRSVLDTDNQLHANQFSNAASN